GARHGGSTVSPHGCRGLTASAFSLPWRSASDAKRGKSGGYRIIYYLHTQESVLLVTIYSKTEQSDIDDAEVVDIIRQVEDS
ncbi:MAG: hypothetical protein KZQ78_02180, partial [Candidatus Thiodiazotropha sp. (ex Ustalcina ferruginea)]|nr:hypothetical protein [Candidatus Thiodiazotropha sp. (ex Ustalcina ferruginea)]